MREDRSGAYVLSRRGGRNKKSAASGRRIAGVIISMLLLASVGICLAVVFYPQGSESASASGFGGKTVYFLATAETESRDGALLEAKSASDRGGAGYIYNDGKYHVVAAAYERESDVKTLVTVNADSHYFSLSFSGGEYAPADERVIEYLLGEWFGVMSGAASELERGNITEAKAERAAFSACNTLLRLADGAGVGLRRALSDRSFSAPSNRSLLSSIRYFHVEILFSVYYAMQ